MTRKVLLLSKYSRKGASSRLRTLQYLPYLETKGFDITAQSLFDDRYLDNLYTKGHRSAFGVAKLYFIRLVTFLSFYKYDLIWIDWGAETNSFSQDFRVQSNFDGGVKAI